MDYQTAKYEARETGQAYYAHMRTCESCRPFVFANPECGEGDELRAKYAQCLEVLAYFSDRMMLPT